MINEWVVVCEMVRLGEMVHFCIFGNWSFGDVGSSNEIGVWDNVVLSTQKLKFQKTGRFCHIDPLGKIGLNELFKLS